MINDYLKKNSRIDSTIVRQNNTGLIIYCQFSILCIILLLAIIIIILQYYPIYVILTKYKSIFLDI